MGRLRGRAIRVRPGQGVLPIPGSAASRCPAEDRANRDADSGERRCGCSPAERDRCRQRMPSQGALTEPSGDGLRQRRLPLQVAAIPRYSPRGTPLRGHNNEVKNRSKRADPNNNRAELQRRVRGGASQPGVQFSGGAAAGNLRGEAGEAKIRGQDNVSGGQAVHEGQQNAHGPVAKARVHALKVVRHVPPSLSAAAAGARSRRRRRSNGAAEGVLAHLRPSHASSGSRLNATGLVYRANAAQLSRCSLASKIITMCSTM